MPGSAQWDLEVGWAEGRSGTASCSPGRGAAGRGDVNLDTVDLRRLRSGFKLFGNLTAHAEGEFDYEEDPTYQRLTDAYLAWKFSDGFSLKVGKQAMSFTLDGSTSSKELLTIDRSNLANNFWFTNEYLPGITLSGKSGNWVYNTGVFSQGEADGEFGNFDAGTSWLASLGYDFSEQLGADEALLMVDYVFNEETPAGTGLFTNRSLHQVLSVNFLFEKGRFGFRGDVSVAQGFLGQSDISGITAMPYYNFTDKLQGIFRYTYLESSGDNGLRLARYESEALNSGRGDRYNELYAGLNYFIYGHKLKLQSGLQYTWMIDDANDGGEFDGLSWITGFRLSW